MAERDFDPAPTDDWFAQNSPNWWDGPAPAGYYGVWPPPLGPGQSYGPNLGQIVNATPTGDVPTANPTNFVPPATTEPVPTTPTSPTPTPTATTPLSGYSAAEVIAKAAAYYKSKWGVDADASVLAQIKADLGFVEGARIQESTLPTIAAWIDGHKPATKTVKPPPPPPTTTGGPGDDTHFGGAPTAYASDPNAPQYSPLGTYEAPTWTGGDFQNPTVEDLEASPGYAARLKAGLQARNRAAAAQGTVLNGGTLKALDREAQNFAASEYQTLRSNKYDEYKERYGHFQDAAGMDLGARTVNANANQQTFLNRTSTYGANNTRTLADYITNVTNKRNSELDYWNRLMDVTRNATGTIR